jgi:hypothetical protein
MTSCNFPSQPHPPTSDKRPMRDDNQLLEPSGYLSMFVHFLGLAHRGQQALPRRSITVLPPSKQSALAQRWHTTFALTSWSWCARPTGSRTRSPLFGAKDRRRSDPSLHALHIGIQKKNLGTRFISIAIHIHIINP